MNSNRYLWGPAVDQVLADEQVSPDGLRDYTTDQILWPLADHQGTVRDLAEVNGSGDTEIVNTRTYDAYGNLLAETAPAVDHLFGFTGRPTEGETGLQNNLNRWYDPEVGTWLNEDPIGFEGGDANLSRYCGNNPVNMVDPSGLLSEFERELYERYKRAKTRDLSDEEMVAWLIYNALIIADGDVSMATGMLYNMRNSDDVQDDEVLACAEHFFQSWIVQKLYSADPTGVCGALAASGINAGYSLLKSNSITRNRCLSRDKADNPPTPGTVAQYKWGCVGSWAALWYNLDLNPDVNPDPTSAEWKSFKKWLDGKVSKPNNWPRETDARSYCFVAGTEVSTPAGTRPIESLATGDQVISRNLSKDELEESTVLRAMAHEASEIYTVMCNGDQIEVTAEHPFHVVGKGWTRTEDLMIGDKLYTIDGHSIAIEEISVATRKATVYNITVEGNHNYHVGRNAILVHNK